MLPLIIQGGMGVGISGWLLANAVASRGQLGVVAGTALDTTLVRRLNDGDSGGDLRRGMAAFPIPGVAAQALKAFFRPDGRQGAPYTLLKQCSLKLGRARERLLALASFTEVFLAREGHAGRVGINLLTKVQIPNLAVLYGAMLAGVDYVLMGAGIPREIPGALDRLADNRPASIRIDVLGKDASDHETLTFTPEDLWEDEPAEAKRPAFLPIVAANSLATMMARKATGRIDGLVVEGPTAGGHNAPPRGAGVSKAAGPPVYGERDRVNLQKLADLGLPFWVAGGAGTPDRLVEARAEGAAGIQVGTLFAYSDESGLRSDLKSRVIQEALDGTADVRTDSRASPTGFPFKVVSLEDTLSDVDAYEERKRICDLGYLRTPYRRPDGGLGFRCAAEPVRSYVHKGGRPSDAEGRKCLCNALTSDIGLGQDRDNAAGKELPLLTSGEDLRRLGGFLHHRTHYSAGDVLDYLLGPRALGKANERTVCDAEQVSTP